MKRKHLFYRFTKIWDKSNISLSIYTFSNILKNLIVYTLQLVIRMIEQ